MIKTHENKKQEKIKINFVVNRRYSIFNMFTESNYFVNFCLNVPPPPSTVSIFCECAEHKNSEIYSFYINVQWWCVSKWNIMHFTLLLSEHSIYIKFTSFFKLWFLPVFIPGFNRQVTFLPCVQSYINKIYR